MFVPIAVIVFLVFLVFWSLGAAYNTYLEQYPRFKFDFDFYYKYSEEANTYYQIGPCPRWTGVKDVILTFFLYLMIPRVCSIIKQSRLTRGTFTSNR
jgi:hypothetical protein